MLPEQTLVWTDTNISPSIDKWLNEQFAQVSVVSFYKLNFQTEKDRVIFLKAKEANALFITKDKDFLDLLKEVMPPPSIIYLKTGNVSNSELKTILTRNFKNALDLINLSGYDLVQIF